MTCFTRRNFLGRAALLPLVSHLLPLERSVRGASPAAIVQSYSEELPDMLLSYLVQKTNAFSDEWDRVRNKIQTTADVEARNRFVREKAVEMLGGFPERNPLNPVIVATHERDGYRVENVMLQSRPNFWVTANLYVPTKGNGPFPGIISPCGHSAEARIYPPYQFTYLGLVKSGFVVLAYDPIGQGERRHYWNPQTKKNEIGGPVTWEHSLPGQLLLLLGENLTEYRIWDGMRAIDYLLTRPEVDAKRIGCTGQSGGGTLTLFISALDERVRCAAVHEGGTGHRWPIELRPESRVETGDTEQHFFPAAIYGVDLCDLHAAIAPRPLLATIENYSPHFNETARHILNRYRQLGVPERFSTEEAQDPHAMTVKLRLATTDWFCRWFYNRRGPSVEPDFEPERPETLYCTPNGSIRYSQHGETIFSLILKEQAQLPPPRKIPADRAELDSFRSEIAGRIRELLHYRKFDLPVAVRHIGTTPRKGYQIEKVEFLSEPGIYIPTWVFVPEKKTPGSPALLYVHEAGKEADGLEFDPLEKLARKGHLVVAVDVRGIGETKPPHQGEWSPGEFRHVDNVETVMSYWAWEISESLVGMRVQDVIRCVDYVLSRPDVDPRGVCLIGKGMGALWSLFAAALDPRILAAVCVGGLLSYRSLTQADRYQHGADIFIPNVLKHFDLPHVAAAVADRPLALLAPVDAMKNPVEISVARQAYEWTNAAYSVGGAPEHFRILGRSEDLDITDQYLHLLNMPQGTSVPVKGRSPNV